MTNITESLVSQRNNKINNSVESLCKRNAKSMPENYKTQRRYRCVLSSHNRCTNTNHQTVHNFVHLLTT